MLNVADKSANSRKQALSGATQMLNPAIVIWIHELMETISISAEHHYICAVIL